LFRFYLNSYFAIFQRAWWQEQAAIAILMVMMAGLMHPSSSMGFPSIQMIVADAAGNGGRAEMGGATEVVENLPAPDVLPR
jgi:hypothetical protein